MYKRRFPVSLPLISLAFCLLLLSCHPYYNTFYNAEEAYRAAQREHVKFMRAFPDSIVVAAPASAEAMYDRAIEKSLKMMEVYPKDQKNQDKAHYLMGRSSFYKKDFEVCVGRMRDLQAHYPESQLVPPSQVYVAKAHIMMDNLVIAEEILYEVLNSHPHLDRNQEITMLLVEIAMRRGGRSQALEILAGIRLSSLPLERRVEVILRMADLNYELRQYEKALGLLRSAPRSKKHPSLMYRIDRSIYYCHDAMDSLDIALEHLWTMQRNRHYADFKYETMYYLAVTLRRMQRFDEAIALFDEIKRMCGKADKADTISLCGRTAYELALIYQELGMFDKAAAEFEEAAKYKGLPIVGKVSARLWALNRLKELRKPDSLGNIPPVARFSIAELFRFELEIPDSAYIYYMELASDTSAGDSLRPRSLLSAAIVSKYQMEEAKRADSLLNVVIDEYTGTEYARRAQIEMDVEITVVTAREMAERDFRSAEAMLENDPVEAVKAFYEIHKRYPDLDMAARSLHAAAWYTNHVLQRNRAAMTLYEELCEKYPKSEYCVSSATPRVTIARDSMEVRRQRRAEREAAVSADTTGEAVLGDSVGVGVRGGVRGIDRDDGDDDDDDVDNDTAVVDTPADVPADGVDTAVDTDINTDTGVDANTDTDTAVDTDTDTDTDVGPDPDGP
jgi:TolA-binding protein